MFDREQNKKNWEILSGIRVLVGSNPTRHEILAPSRETADALEGMLTEMEALQSYVESLMTQLLEKQQSMETELSGNSGLLVEKIAQRPHPLYPENAWGLTKRDSP